MNVPADKAARFRALHVSGKPLLMPNPWDPGTARLLASLGFQAVATTSGGHAATLGRPDGSVDRAAALAHARSIVAAVDVPVSADLENGFADDPEGVARTVRDAIASGLAGCSIEDFTGNADTPIYDIGLAAERVAGAAEAARAGPGLVLTARAENFIRGNPDLFDTISRLQAYQDAGADVLYAPGLTSIADIRHVLASVDRPVNVLVRPGLATVADLAEAGVARISVGGAFSQVALAAVTRAGRELLAKAPTASWTSPPKAANRQPTPSTPAPRNRTRSRDSSAARRRRASINIGQPVPPTPRTPEELRSKCQ
ncbi:MAG: isocitrate lyase/phosphoenolpyruvate mutase family protein [Actinobacteria bacterium]|nr:isocitrate lyase/phosphoenolpyruvate mutase family protein [Actinomycetota bacterium]